MALIVQKFGGSSLSSIENIIHIADIVIKERTNSNQVVVVVSAMQGATDQLIKNITQITDITNIEEKQEYDAIVSAGEQISSGLLALALRAKGFHARSWAGWQLPIYTDGNAAKGQITNINPKNIYATLANNEIPVIAGFQGIYQGRIVTLGRGGSDTTATAVAATIKADRCDIYTDVEGVYTADPYVVHKAKKLDYITYGEMLEMASSGSNVLHERAIAIAMKHNLKTQVLSSFINLPGTMINEGNKDDMEQTIIRGITSVSNLVCITLQQISNTTGTAAKLCNILTSNNVTTDMIIQNNGNKYTDISFIINSEYTRIASKCLMQLKGEYFNDIVILDKLAKISVIGIGIKNDISVIEKMFAILAEKQINIIIISTSEIKINVLIKKEYQDLAVCALHTGYNLDRESI